MSHTMELDRNGNPLPGRRPDGTFLPVTDPSPCPSCGGTRQRDRKWHWPLHGMCKTCSRRHEDHGFPAGGPPPPVPGGRAGEMAGRLEDYTILRYERGMGAAEVARAMGLTRRTLRRYDARLREVA